MKSQTALLTSDQFRLIEKTTDVAAEGIIITDALQPHNPIIYVNGGFVRLTGFSRDEILGQNCRFLQGEETNPQSLDQIREAVREQREVIVELLNYRKDAPRSGIGFQLPRLKINLAKLRIMSVSSPISWSLKIPGINWKPPIKNWQNFIRK